ncbi:MAG TPA: 6,7-dimethyl-8-ribityllumazine synthase [Burkholderiales bacterium]|nr:6,7-dimethyl-8-ribityllumazine synthase [Burkholderiales bacterium]
MNELKPNLDGKSLSIAIVMSRFNKPVCEGLLASCKSALAECGVADSHVALVTVPGALEIPLALERFAQSGRFDALIALGAVIRGETYHFEVVSNESARGVMEVQLEWGIPIANGILTTENDEQALARVSEKGADAARVAVEMANFLKASNELR